MVHPFFTTCAAFGVAAIFILFTYEWRRAKPQPYRPRYYDSADKRPSPTANDSDSADKPPADDSAANRPATPTDDECEKCLYCDQQPNTHLIPCNHECMCVDCIDIHLKFEKKCPLCRINIEKFSSLP
ncbi:E3 ubiquitin-protein ligase, partial [Stegodyphus mimosarum]